MRWRRASGPLWWWAFVETRIRVDKAPPILTLLWFCAPDLIRCHASPQICVSLQLSGDRTTSVDIAGHACRLAQQAAHSGNLGRHVAGQSRVAQAGGAPKEPQAEARERKLSTSSVCDLLLSIDQGATPPDKDLDKETRLVSARARCCVASSRVLLFHRQQRTELEPASLE